MSDLPDLFLRVFLLLFLCVLLVTRTEIALGTLLVLLLTTSLRWAALDDRQVETSCPAAPQPYFSPPPPRRPLSTGLPCNAPALSVLGQNRSRVERRQCACTRAQERGGRHGKPKRER